jgi:hypothetical protein
VEHPVKHNANLLSFVSMAYSKADTPIPPFGMRARTKGNMFPFALISSRVGDMNRLLSDFQIRSTCRALLKGGRVISGRKLRRELLDRFGAVGKTERVFQIWREAMAEQQRAAVLNGLPTEVAELQRRMALAESQAAANLKRAELAEYREQAHQDHWALKLDELRRELEEARRENAAGQGRVNRVFPV